MHWKLFWLLRKLRPDLVHTRNLAALECQLVAWLCGVKGRIHGEHGRDVEDLDGTSRKHRWIRKLYRPFVTHYIALSKDLAAYLRVKIQVNGEKITQIYNGVDLILFHPTGRGMSQSTHRLPLAKR